MPTPLRAGEPVHRARPVRMFVDAVLLDSACLGSLGVDEIRVPAPVGPGDTLHGRLRVLSRDLPTCIPPCRRSDGGRLFTLAQGVAQVTRNRLNVSLSTGALPAGRVGGGLG